MFVASRRVLNLSLDYSRHKAPRMIVNAVLNDTRWWRARATKNTPSHAVYTESIEQSPQDLRSYKLIRLENGLEAMLVHDKDADTSAASMDIAVGHLHDPVSYLLSYFFPFY